MVYEKPTIVEEFIIERSVLFACAFEKKGKPNPKPDDPPGCDGACHNAGDSVTPNPC